MPRYNPFRPGNIVTPGMFSGRGEELITLERVLFQTKNDNSHHFLMHGERGIGKSSLLYYLQSMARGEIESFESGHFNFLTLSVELEPANKYLDIIRKVGSEFHRAVDTHQRARALLRNGWEFIKRWEVLGVKY